jgi:hypothetical protein
LFAKAALVVRKEDSNFRDPYRSDLFNGDVLDQRIQDDRRLALDDGRP